mmetsp:Transcript_21230/g.35129  ORF Transcript_21230/g.35129 Transcript_21230/m.35129 type:complete len:144 (+) Transcript_21230:226-657(+)|eukprot:CAMPEP_0119002796 /NCGR_PEP_ID=MMETSP1176-20130426/129_1 /TAXON_ID=265551 /ORGANISM="Synedropsis recta cf, Strain CCMP1620" /LENGTH=143 /DNA_ID=CAMNT_0006954321 /DNA_START=194 /DNA_END=625 /DNA_ORIENTATION=-
MKPDWDKLGDEYAGSNSVMIGDVDCTEDGKELCEKFSVSGYPTIKFFKDGDVTTGEDYQQGRDFFSLQKFVQDELEVKCNPSDPTECTDKEKAYITKMTDKTADERKAQHDRLTKMKGNSMKAELKAWLHQRLNILSGLDQEL